MPEAISLSSPPVTFTDQELAAQASLPPPNQSAADPATARRDAGVQVLLDDFSGAGGANNGPSGARGRGNTSDPSAPPPPVSPPRPDWCGSLGSGWVPDGGFGVEWSDACRKHDECYGTPGADKDICDENLGEDIASACEEQGGGLGCYAAAGIYRAGVTLFGDEAFERAQEAARAR